MFGMSTGNAWHEFAKQGIKNRPVPDRAIHVSSDISSRLYLLFAVLSKEKQDAKQEDRQHQQQIQGKHYVELVSIMLVKVDIINIPERTKGNLFNFHVSAHPHDVTRNAKSPQQKNDPRINANSDLCRCPTGESKPFQLQAPYLSQVIF